MRTEIGKVANGHESETRRLLEREHLQLFERKLRRGALQRARRDFEEVRGALNARHQHFTFGQMQRLQVARQIGDVLARRRIVAEVVLGDEQMLQIGIGRADEVAQLLRVRRQFHEIAFGLLAGRCTGDLQHGRARMRKTAEELHENAVGVRLATEIDHSP